MQRVMAAHPLHDSGIEMYRQMGCAVKKFIYEQYAKPHCDSRGCAA